MTQYKSIKVNMSNLQIKKLKSEIKNGTEVISNLSSDVVGDSNDNINFPHKLLWTNRHVKLLQISHQLM